ncbi:Protein of unknown function (DUF1706), partial [Snodgrassella alvi SCGC AB-598-P14]
QAEWQPCPMELLEKIILHFYNHVSELNLVRMLASRKNNISKSIINILCKLTKFYRDYQDITDFKQLLSLLETNKKNLISLIDSFSNEELYGSPWHEKYTRGRM